MFFFFVHAGLGGAVGYALGGLDWTHTFLGTAFQSQEQILFFFAAVLFSISVILHLLSIEEEQYLPQNDRIEQVRHQCQSKRTLFCLVCFVLPIRTDHVTL